MPGYFSIPGQYYPQYSVGILSPPPTPRVPARTATPAETGGPVRGYDPRYGGVPSAPSVSAESLNAILTNLSNLAKMTELGTGVGKASAEAARQQVLASIPNFDPLMGKFGQNIAAGAAGVIDPDVQAMLNEKLAGFAGRMGSAGGPIEGAAALRAMGLTGYDLKERALKDMATYTGLAPIGPAWNPASVMSDVGTQLATAWLRNQLEAAPVPAAARADELNRQAAALAAGSRAGIMPYGSIAPGTSGDPGMAWLRDIINRAGTASAAPSSIVPRGTTPTQQSAVLGTRTEEDLINEFLDEIAPVTWPATGTQAGGDTLTGYIPQPWTTDYGYFGSQAPTITDYIGAPTMPDYTGLPEDYYAFPEWYD